MSGQKKAQPGGQKRKGRPLPEARRVEALNLLAEGHTVTAVAAQVKVKRDTVAAWRDSPEGQKVLDDARQKRAEALKGAAAKARAVLDDAAVRASQVLVDALGASAPNVRVRAAREILGRVGVPTLTESRVTVNDDGADLSRLSLEELRTLDELNRKARGG